MSKKVTSSASARGKAGSSSSDAVAVDFKDFHAALDDLQKQLAKAAKAKPGVKAIASLRTYLEKVKVDTRCQKGMTSTF